MSHTQLLCEVGCEALEAENVEHAGEIVAERHQAPFATNLFEAADQEVLIAGAAFERPERMLDDGGAPSHQFRISSAAPSLAILWRCRSRTASCSQRLIVRYCAFGERHDAFNGQSPQVAL